MISGYHAGVAAGAESDSIARPAAAASARASRPPAPTPADCVAPLTDGLTNGAADDAAQRAACCAGTGSPSSSVGASSSEKLSPETMCQSARGGSSPGGLATISESSGTLRTNVAMREGNGGDVDGDEELGPPLAGDGDGVAQGRWRRARRLLIGDFRRAQNPRRVAVAAGAEEEGRVLRQARVALHGQPGRTSGWGARRGLHTGGGGLERIRCTTPPKHVHAHPCCSRRRRRRHYLEQCSAQMARRG